MLWGDGSEASSPVFLLGCLVTKPSLSANLSVLAFWLTVRRAKTSLVQQQYHLSRGSSQQLLDYSCFHPCLLQSVLCTVARVAAFENGKPYRFRCLNSSTAPIRFQMTSQILAMAVCLHGLAPVHVCGLISSHSSPCSVVSNYCFLLDIPQTYQENFYSHFCICSFFCLEWFILSLHSYFSLSPKGTSQDHPFFKAVFHHNICSSPVIFFFIELITCYICIKYVIYRHTQHIYDR